MKIFSIGLLTWIVGACTFYRVWLTRCEMIQTKYGDWRVYGWPRTDEWGNLALYSVLEVKLFSFFLWIPLTLIISVREVSKFVGLTLGRIANVFFELATPSKVKKQMRRNMLPVSTHDAAMIAAIEEVEYIVSPLT